MRAQWGGVGAKALRHGHDQADFHAADVVDVWRVGKQQRQQRHAPRVVGDRFVIFDPAPAAGDAGAGAAGARDAQATGRSVSARGARCPPRRAHGRRRARQRGRRGAPAHSPHPARARSPLQLPAHLHELEDLAGLWRGSSRRPSFHRRHCSRRARAVRWGRARTLNEEGGSRAEHASQQQQ